MPPKASGTVTYLEGKDGAQGHYKARIRLLDGSRPWIHFDPGPQSAKAEESAKHKAAHWTERAQRERLTAADLCPRRGAAPAVITPTGETCAEWWKRFLEWKEGKGQATVKDARGRFTKWIAPHIGPTPMRSVTRADLERVVTALDEAVRGDLISWKTADNIWGEVTSAFKQACSSKLATLRVLDVNPAANVQGPDSGTTKAKPILYPSEALALLSCERVPLNRRQLYAVAIYTGARSNELAALTARDVDLVHARISIAKQVDRETGDDKQTKTKKARAFDVEPNLLPLLTVLVAEHRQGRLLHLPPDEMRASLLRKDLLTAGVAREALHVENDPSREWMKFHNLRDTCLTWMAVRGDDPLRVQWRGGHSDFKMTEAYIAAGRNLGGGFGKPFPPLPPSIVGDVEPALASDDEARETDEADGEGSVPRSVPESFPDSESPEISSSEAASPTGFESGLGSSDAMWRPRSAARCAA